jgi:pimeloyl-ACP methyl ester carboxylesterase
MAPTDPLKALNPLERAVYETTVLADVALRTALGSVVAAAAVPWGLSPAAASENRRLDFYRELAADADPSRTFPDPPRVRVEIATPGRVSLPLGQREARLLRFSSPYVAVNPAVRRAYGGHSRNRVAYAQHWTHEDGPRPTICVIHGFGASPYWLNSAFFALPWFFGHGYDVLLYTMPFHGLRRGLLAPINGTELFAHGIAHFNEAIIHAVHDFRVFVDHLEREGVEAIGLTGVSLGGYMTALLAAVEPRLRFAIPNAAVIDLEVLQQGWFPTNLAFAGLARLRGLPREEMLSALTVHSPLTYAPLVAPERRMIIGGLGDRLAPPEQSELLWEHWGRPRIHWFVGNHVMHLSRGVYLKEMRRFMTDLGFEAASSGDRAAHPPAPPKRAGRRA